VLDLATSESTIFVAHNHVGLLKKSARRRFYLR
jgi:hypothetical protein